MPLPKPEAVKIAGAGPAGLAAAIVLASAGRRVEVHEQRDRVGARWKRGLQILENFSEKEDILDFMKRSGIKASFWRSPIHEITLWAGRGRKHLFRSDVPLGYFVRRGAQPGEFDRGLLDAATAAGAEVRFGSRLGTGEARVRATGPRRVNGIGKEVTFKTPLSDRMTVILDPELAPGGYAYLFIVDGEATMGMAILGGYDRVDELYGRTAARFRQIEGVDPSGGEEAVLVANYFLKDGLTGPAGEIWAGEAGGFQDYLFGFGMRYAVTSGVLAARSISEDLEYNTLWKQTLLGKQKVSLWNRFLYEKGGPWVPSLLIGMARRSGNLRDFLLKFYAPAGWRLLLADAIAGSWKSRKLILNPKDLNGDGNI
jgi:flavin-dependent dehydrogenase